MRKRIRVRRSPAAVILAGLLLWAQPAAADQVSAPVRTLPAPGDVVGEAVLGRTEKAAFFTFSTTRLTPGHAYTVWLVAFNNPENCTDGCGADDLSNPEVQAASLLGGAGQVAGGDGTVFAGRRKVGVPAHHDKGESGSGLLDPMGAEIHLVLRTHGRAIPGMVYDQTHSFNGGCRPGDPNEGRCANVQFAVFMPAR